MTLTQIIIVLNSLLLVAASIFLTIAVSGRNKYKQLYSDAIKELALIKRRFEAEAKVLLDLKERLDFQDGVFRKIDTGEYSLDELNALRSGVRPQPAQPEMPPLVFPDS